jgi:hypothetical protein
MDREAVLRAAVPENGQHAASPIPTKTTRVVT